MNMGMNMGMDMVSLMGLAMGTNHRMLDSRLVENESTMVRSLPASAGSLRSREPVQGQHQRAERHGNRPELVRQVRRSMEGHNTHGGMHPREELRRNLRLDSSRSRCAIFCSPRAPRPVHAARRFATAAGGITSARL